MQVVHLLRIYWAPFLNSLPRLLLSCCCLARAAARVLLYCGTLGILLAWLAACWSAFVASFAVICAYLLYRKTKVKRGQKWLRGVLFSQSVSWLVNFRAGGDARVDWMDEVMSDE